MKKLLLLLLFAATVSACNDAVQKAPEAEVAEEANTNGEPAGPHTSVEWKIWALSTAAPSFIAANCTVVDVDQTVLREGTNGWTAMAGNPRGMSDPENG